MAIIETKYAKGDVVYGATTVREQRRAKCPDCLETRKWIAKSPAGVDYELGCPRCSTGYLSDPNLSLTYLEEVGSVTKLTIGLVRFDGECAEYMAHETGIGSGSLWREDQLFNTEEEAKTYGDMLGKLNDAEREKHPQPMTKPPRVSDYNIGDARLEAARKENSALQWKVHDLLMEIREAETLADAIAKIDEVFP